MLGNKLLVRKHIRNTNMFFTFINFTTHKNNTILKISNPRSRDGSDIIPGGYCRACTVISIHAPVRGATRYKDQYSKRIIISIHAPMRGATHAAIDALTEERFQSTLPRGERPFFLRWSW